jgi:vacuolar-type H+-ATPase subunit H
MSEHMDAMSEHNDLLPLRSPEEAPPAFELVRRGYDRDQVDNHLGWLEDQLRNAEIARDAAEHAAASAAAEAEAAREELESGRPQWHEFGDRITEILNLAEEQGAQIRAQRSQEADELLQEARQLSADTERDCAQRVREAEATSTQIVSDAQARAEDILTTAQTEADRLTMRTQQETAELERQSSRRLADLERQRDAVNAQLTRMHEALQNALAPAISIDDSAKPKAEAGYETAEFGDSSYEDDDLAAAPAAPASADVRRR